MTDCSETQINVRNLSHILKKTIRRLPRCLLVFALLVGILLPRMSAVLIEALPGVQSMVLCTGSEMIVVTIGPDGKPIGDIEAEPGHCVMGDGVALAEAPKLFWHTLALEFDHSFTIRESRRFGPDQLALLLPPRAPPVVV